jgi:hypothetical protein
VAAQGFQYSADIPDKSGSLGIEQNTESTCQPEAKGVGNTASKGVIEDENSVLAL